MKKIILATLALAVISLSSVSAQSYQGDVSISPGVSFGNGFTSFIVNAQTTQGFRLNDSWLVGLGVGYNSYFIDGEYAGYVPLTAHGKYYFRGSAPLFVSADVGYAFGVVNASGFNGFYFSPLLGWQTNSGLFFGLGYQMHFTSGFEGLDNGIIARIGFKW